MIKFGDQLITLEDPHPELSGCITTLIVRNTP